MSAAMELPKYHEIFMQILEVLDDGDTMHYHNMCKNVRDKYYSHLPETLRNKKTTTGANVLLDRIGWAKSYLKAGRFLHYPKRGMVQILEKGNAALRGGRLTLQDIKKDKDWLDYRESVRTAKESKDEDDDSENSTPQDRIDAGFLALESQVKGELLDKLKNIDPYYFQRVILILLEKMGYGEFMETPRSVDGGIDGVINEDKLGLGKIYIQAKRYSESKVREPEIRDFIGAMSGDTLKGIFVTTSSFDDKARDKARDARHSIALIDGKKLVNLMYQHGVGVQVRNTYEVKAVDEDFFEES